MKIFGKMLIVFILMLAVMSVFSFTSVYADPGGGGSGDPGGGGSGDPGGGGSGATGVQVNPDDYQPETISTADAAPLISIGGFLLSLLRNIGVIIAVIVLSVIGLKYMFGSVEEKANYKQTMVPIVVGAILLMGSSIFVQVIFNVLTKKG